MLEQPPAPPGTTSTQAAQGPVIRVVARIADGILLGLVCWGLSLVLDNPSLDVFETSTGFAAGLPLAERLANHVTAAALTVGWFMLFEPTVGATPAKLALGLRVRSQLGGHPTPAQSFRRNAWLLLALVPFIGGLLQSVAGLAIILTMPDTNRGWHDRLADTVVVRR